MFNFFTRVTVSTQHCADCKIKWPFESGGMLLLNESASGIVVEYSFDGVTLHGDLDPDLPSMGISCDGRAEDTIYFRLKYASSPATIRFEVWE